MTNEIQLLLEASEKKKTILNKILDNSKEQETLAKASDLDVEGFDALVDHKSDLLEQMERIDKGFDSVYNKIRNELVDNKQAYQSDIQRMQGQIKDIIDLGAQIAATEMRTKELLSDSIQRQRQEFTKKKMTSQSVFEYYKSANQLNQMEPFFMDQKK